MPSPLTSEPSVPHRLPSFNQMQSSRQQWHISIHRDHPSSTAPQNINRPTSPRILRLVLKKKKKKKTLSMNAFYRISMSLVQFHSFFLSPWKTYNQRNDRRSATVRDLRAFYFRWKSNFTRRIVFFFLCKSLPVFEKIPTVQESYQSSKNKLRRVYANTLSMPHYTLNRRLQSWISRFKAHELSFCYKSWKMKLGQVAPTPSKKDVPYCPLVI